MSDVDLGNLEQKALDIAKYYYKDFGNTIEMIMCDALQYLKHPEVDYKDRVMRHLSKIKDFYSGIPFEDLRGRDEFSALFEIRDLLPQFSGLVNRHFEAPNKESLEEIRSLGNRIVETGRPYWGGLVQLLETIKSHPESNGFTVNIIDDSGRQWTFGYPKKAK